MTTQDFEHRLRDLAARYAAGPNDDPFGFHRMTPAQLANWIGAGHAEVGSQRWEQAKAVYELKLAELKASPIPAPAPPPAPPTPWWQRGYWQAAIGIAGILGALIALLTFVGE